MPNELKKEKSAVVFRKDNNFLSVIAYFCIKGFFIYFCDVKGYSEKDFGLGKGLGLPYGHIQVCPYGNNNNICLR